jgi:hypothetical protein
MAPIPKEMQTWSPKLYSLLVDDFYKSDVFKRPLGSTHSFTCTNIPVLVAILVYLDHKLVISFHENAHKLVARHYSKGAFLWTRNQRKKKEWPIPHGDGICWTFFMKLKIDTFDDEEEDDDEATIRERGQLHSVLNLLLYGHWDLKKLGKPVSPGTVLFREKVDNMIQDLTFSMIEDLVSKSNVLDSVLWKSNVTVPTDGPDNDNELPPDPFITKDEAKSIFQAESKEKRRQIMEEIRKNYIAKAMNISLHLMLDEKHHIPDDNEAVDADDTDDNDERKMPAKDLGHLSHLMKPKKPKDGEAHVPQFFKNTADAEEIFDGYISDCGIDWEDRGPEEIWEGFETAIFVPRIIPNQRVLYDDEAEEDESTGESITETQRPKRPRCNPTQAGSSQESQGSTPVRNNSKRKNTSTNAASKVPPKKKGAKAGQPKKDKSKGGLKAATKVPPKKGTIAGQPKKDKSKGGLKVFSRGEVASRPDTSLEDDELEFDELENDELEDDELDTALKAASKVPPKKGTIAGQPKKDKSKGGLKVFSRGEVASRPDTSLEDDELEDDELENDELEDDELDTALKAASKVPPKKGAIAGQPKKDKSKGGLKVFSRGEVASRPDTSLEDDELEDDELEDDEMDTVPQASNAPSSSPSKSPREKRSAKRQEGNEASEKKGEQQRKRARTEKSDVVRKSLAGVFIQPPDSD